MEPNLNELNDSEITMIAVEESLSALFDEVDNDSQYHKSISSLQNEVVHGQCSRDPEEIAESILAWSGAIK